jgi:hypothetical protein
MHENQRKQLYIKEILKCFCVPKDSCSTPGNLFPFLSLCFTIFQVRRRVCANELCVIIIVGLKTSFTF